MRSDPEREAEHSENLPAVKGSDGRSQKSEMTSRYPRCVPGSPEAGHSKWWGDSGLCRDDAQPCGGEEYLPRRVRWSSRGASSPDVTPSHDGVCARELVICINNYSFSNF